MAACSHQCMFRHGNPHLIIFLLIFSISALTHFSFLAHGREMPKQLEQDRPQKGNEENVVRVRSLIGSRPPRCESRCRNCGHCEAVQVPIVPTFKHQQTSRGSHGFKEVPKHVAYTRGDYLSNYKPMCWKCKCGDLLFNP
ncbi:EPIDERMAL PATTERNING FACTOR-like protein 2 [Ipomoea triloba]|uniref:EPIDERMAL PATTERNING FACTOR-like protein 2 n=1 Tax=Ipomoea triloba TaxID=35885 RepID=UPI00125D2D0A|nr:EPIDERMAL PATTERNING FACTOR-like protein 2 [Ipomoea triloba]GMD89200.1 EPIDERMAL PATTERNING FACTOR-like protein 2 [Ipomoea batatas]